MTIKMDELFNAFLLDDEEGFDGSESLDVNTVVVRAQYILDGASSLGEAADMARAFADYLDGLSEDGYELVEMIQDDRGFASLND